MSPIRNGFFQCALGDWYSLRTVQRFYVQRYCSTEEAPTFQVLAEFLDKDVVALSDYYEEEEKARKVLNKIMNEAK